MNINGCFPGYRLDLRASCEPVNPVHRSKPKSAICNLHSAIRIPVFRFIHVSCELCACCVRVLWMCVLYVICAMYAEDGIDVHTGFLWRARERRTLLQKKEK